jgi:hypothetical protein
MAPPKPKTVFRYNQNIYILEDPLAYRKEVERYLKLIESTYAGRTLTKHINARISRLLIIPYVPSEKEGWVNTQSFADRPLDAYPKGELVRDSLSANVPGFGLLVLPIWVEGTGAGSTVTLRYHPANLRQFNLNRGQIDPGTGPGEALYHEMVHALQSMQGVRSRTAIPENPHMDNFTEFCAIVAANIYRSERGFTRLRQDHRLAVLGRDASGKDLTDPNVFAAVYSDPFEKWFRLQPVFCADLAASTAPFNPLKYAAAGLGYPIRTPMALPP